MRGLFGLAMVLVLTNVSIARAEKQINIQVATYDGPRITVEVGKGGTLRTKNRQFRKVPLSITELWFFLDDDGKSVAVMGKNPILEFCVSDGGFRLHDGEHVTYDSKVTQSFVVFGEHGVARLNDEGRFPNVALADDRATGFYLTGNQMTAGRNTILLDPTPKKLYAYVERAEGGMVSRFKPPHVYLRDGGVVDMYGKAIPLSELSSFVVTHSGMRSFTRRQVSR